MDLFVGDLPLFIELTELRDYDIFTYTQGDTENLYLRGQFAPHRNTPSVNTLFLWCGPCTGLMDMRVGLLLDPGSEAMRDGAHPLPIARGQQHCPHLSLPQGARGWARG